MKLSEAIELALVNKAYCVETPYMCHALVNINLDEFVGHVMAMVKNIYPWAHSLLGALGYINAPCRNWLADDCTNFQVTKQLYCWWVFDLKRKGL